VEKTGLDLYTIFETKKMRLGRWPATRRVLVGATLSENIKDNHTVHYTEQSAVLGAAREKKISINADHSYICKFKGPTDPSYPGVRGAINELLRSAVPFVTTKNAETGPTAPAELKYVCLKDPNKL
jgi:hypothetical protein